MRSQIITSMSFEFFISFRYLKVKKRHAFISLTSGLSIAGVTLGVMALIIVIAVMSGFESDLKSRILGIKSHLEVTRKDSNFNNYQTVVEKIRTHEAVKAVAPFVSEQMMLRANGRIFGATIKGVDPGSAGQVMPTLDPSLLNQHRNGNQSMALEDHLPGIILGKELARNMGVIKGDRIDLITPRAFLTPVGHMLSLKRFEVAGFFEVGMYEYDMTLAFILLSDAQKLLRIPKKINGIEIRLKEIYQAPEVGHELEKLLGDNYTAKNWIQMNRSLFAALRLEKAAMFIILALIIFVAAFNIASSLIMMVMEKTKDIAILKTMGASSNTIRNIFITMGMLIGGMGVILGMVLGLGVCAALDRYQFIQLPGDVYYITDLPVQVELQDVGLIALAAVVICLLATLYPAHRASKRNPVEALRYG